MSDEPSHEKPPSEDEGDDQPESPAAPDEGVKANGESDHEEGAAEEPAAEEPVAEEPVAEEPVAEGPVSEAGEEPPPVAAASAPLSTLRDIAMPLGALFILATILITFRQVLLPFILACALVYLMEPVIRLVTRRPGRPRGLPRWAGAVVVYLSFILVITTSVVFVVPTFVAEIVRFAEEVPHLVQDFRTEKLPGLNENLQDFLRNYLPATPDSADASGEHFAVAQAAILSARKVAAARSTAFGMVQSSVRFAAGTQVEWHAEPSPENEVGGSYVLVPAKRPPRTHFTLDDALHSGGWVYGHAAMSGLLVEPVGGGALRLNLNEVAIDVEKVSDSAWVIRQKDAASIPVKSSSSSIEIDKMFDLEERLDELIQNLVSTSSERLASVIEFAQKFVVGVVGTFVGVLLTLMVAGFISIDLPRVLAYMRSLVPRHMRLGYDVLLEQLDAGLAGVVRGQLLICVVNGLLTYVGLLIIGIKFRVLLAVIAAILSLIPVFGTVLSTIPIVLIGLTQGASEGLMAFLWILGIHALEANLLNPKIIGSSAHIHPVIVIFALLAGESAYGLVGALLAVPTASILLTLFNFVRTRAWTQAEGLEPSP